MITPKGKSPDHLSVPEEEVTSKGAMDCAEPPTTLEPLEVTIPEALSAPVSPSVTDTVSPFSHRGQRAREYKSIQQNRGAKVFANYKAAVLGRQESQGSLLSVPSEHGKARRNSNIEKFQQMLRSKTTSKI